MCEITERKLNAVKDFFGSWGAVATALGATPPAVSQWLSDGGFPPKRALFVETLTKGKIRAIDLIKMDDAVELAKLMKRG
jgi:DNA-binding transcriptional regulator YdaS (Cro superfamily)